MQETPSDLYALEFIERVRVLRIRYRVQTGRIPTRLVLTADDLAEFKFWLDTADADDKAPYIAMPYTCDPQLYGMSLRFEAYAEQMRVYFQES